MINENKFTFIFEFALGKNLCANNFLFIRITNKTDITPYVKCRISYFPLKINQNKNKIIKYIKLFIPL